jgi:hypothetical protein
MEKLSIQLLFMTTLLVIQTHKITCLLLQESYWTNSFFLKLEKNFKNQGGILKTVAYINDQSSLELLTTIRFTSNTLDTNKQHGI